MITHSKPPLIFLNMKYLSALFIFLVLSACSVAIEQPLLNESNQRLTLNALYSPDRAWEVYLSAPALVTNNTPEPVSNATVSISNEGGEVIVLEEVAAKPGCYTSEEYPRVGSCYTINVEHVLYSPLIAHDCLHLPVGVSFGGEDAEVELGNGEVNYRFTLYVPRIDDVQELFIELTYLNARYRSSTNVTEYRYWTSLKNADILIQDEAYIQYSPSALYMELPSSQEAYVITNAYENTLSSVVESRSGNAAGGASSINFCNVRIISENYYNLGKSWIVHRGLQNNSLRLENPVQLISGEQPRELFSNVEGGQGIFAGYASFRVPL